MGVVYTVVLLKDCAVSPNADWLILPYEKIKKKERGPWQCHGSLFTDT
jgi:hypothetical protein